MTRRWPYLATGVSALAVYAFTLGYPLLWDDVLLLEYVRSLAADGGVLGILSSEFLIGSEGRSLGYYRPIVLLSFWANAIWCGSAPACFHLTNIVLHAVNSVLVLVFLRLALGGKRGAFFGALVFALHPIHTESVVFVSGRTDLWAGLFVLLSSICWLRVRAGRSAHPAAEKAMCALTLALAALSKELAFLLPAVLLAWDFVAVPGTESVPRRFWSRNRQWVLVWLSALAAVSALRLAVAEVGLGVWRMKGAGDPGLQAFHGIPALSHQLFVLRTTLKYLRLLILPFPANAYYTVQQLPWSVLDTLAAATLAAVCLATATRKRGRAGWQALSWIFLFLAPVLGFLPRVGAVVAERFLYVPSIGLSLVAGALFAAGAGVSSWLRPASWAMAVLTLAVSTPLTVSRSRMWQDSVTLFTSITRTTPNFYGGFWNLGKALGEQGRTVEAISAYEEIDRWGTESSSLHYNLGNAYLKEGRYAEARDRFLRAVALDPELADAFNNLGLSYLRLNMFQEAARAHEKALSLRPGEAAFLSNLGSAYGSLGRWEEALDAFRKASAIRPESATSRFNMVLAYLNLGRVDEARRELAVLERIDAALAEKLKRSIPPAGDDPR